MKELKPYAKYFQNMDYFEDLELYIDDKISEPELLRDIYFIYEGRDQSEGLYINRINDKNKKPVFKYNGRVVTPISGERSFNYTVEYDNKTYNIEVVEVDKDVTVAGYSVAYFYLLINGEKYPKDRK